MGPRTVLLPDNETNLVPHALSRPPLKLKVVDGVSAVILWQVILHELGILLPRPLDVPRGVLGMGTLLKVGDGDGGVVRGQGVHDVAVALPQLELLEGGQTGIVDRDSG